MIKIIKDDLVYYKFKKLNDFIEINHFVSTRIGGISNEPYNSLNLGLRTEDDINNVTENFNRLSKAVGIDINDFIIQQQCHSMNVVVIDESYKRNHNINIDYNLTGNDAMITDKSNICLLAFGADCVPVLLYDNVKKVIGICHAGWKGTIYKIVNNTIVKMKSQFGCNPYNIIAAIGPSIGPCCYEIKDDVVGDVKNIYRNYNDILIENKSKDKTYLNLWQANKSNLIESGVKESNIDMSELCTCCNPDLFFSHRQSKGITGRFVAGIMIN